MKRGKNAEVTFSVGLGSERMLLKAEKEALEDDRAG